MVINIQQIEQAWRGWFLKFAPFVYTEGELIQDPNNELYPRITFSYSTADYFVNTLTAFQVWDWGRDSTRLNAACDKIALAVPVMAGASLEIETKEHLEYLHPDTNEWVWFTMDEWNTIVDWHFNRIPRLTVNWRHEEGSKAGAIEIWRGTPFLTPSTKDEVMSRVMYGTLVSRYLNIV